MPDRKIKILDCTLRDGGYINDWQFSPECITNTIKKLEEANIDIIEIGFLDDSKKEYPKHCTLFKREDAADAYLTNAITNLNTNCVLMIMHGKFDISSLRPCNSFIKGIRYCFKKEYIDEALENCRAIQELGYDIYLQPAALSDYDDSEILQLVKKANKLKIKAFYIVDTFGVMRQYDVVRYFYMIDHNLKTGVPIGFHSHNNLQLSFSNAYELIALNSKRTIIIDSSVFGMGRGAGNLCTELIAQYLNENIENKYDLLPILEIMDEYIMPIYNQHPWGYSAPYYIAAINNCHPNYATYLMNLQTLCIRDINAIIRRIPPNERHLYKKDIIHDLYMEYQQNTVEDTNVIQELSGICSGRKVLLLAPGKSLSTYQKQITAFIEENEPVVISINHIPSAFQYDRVFISNLKRFQNIDEAVSLMKDKVIFASNITDDKSLSVINYANYLNENDSIMDNAGLMLINILRKAGVSSLYLAGYDGFSYSSTKNYYDECLVNNVQFEKQQLTNEAIIEYFRKIRKVMHIEFVTPTIYDKGERHESV